MINIFSLHIKSYVKNPNKHAVNTEINVVFTIFQKEFIVNSLLLYIGQLWSSQYYA